MNYDEWKLSNPEDDYPESEEVDEDYLYEQDKEQRRLKNE